MPDVTSPAIVRERTPADLDACVAIVTEVHRLDGYPSFLGEGGYDAFLAPDDRLGAWVAVDDDGVAGNVLLRPRSAPPSVELATASLGVPADRLGFVARLMVAPRARRRGVARQLLEVAAGAARALGRVPVLDVVTRDVAAVALYDASGWRRLGDVRLTMRNGEDLELHVFAKP